MGKINPGIPRGILLFINGFVGLLAIAGVIVSIVLLAGHGQLCSTCLPIAMSLSWASFGITLGVALLSIMGFAAALLRIRGLLIFQTILTILSFCATVTASTIFLVWSTNGNLGPLAPTISGLLVDFQNGIASWAVQTSNAAAWTNWQNTLSCCGVSLLETYTYSDYSTTLETGSACNVLSESVIASIHSQYPSYTANAEAEAAAADLDSDYFCNYQLQQSAAKYTGYLGGILATLAFFQGLLFSMAIVLLCAIREEDGGFAPVDESGNTLGPLTQMKNAPNDITDGFKRASQRMSTGFNVIRGRRGQTSDAPGPNSTFGTGGPITSNPQFQEEQIPGI